MESDSADPLSNEYTFSSFFKLTASSEYLAQLYNLRQEAERSFYFDLSAIQDSMRYRALHRARQMANRLIDDKGELDQNSLERLVQELRDNGYAFYPEGPSDAALTEHALHFLSRLSQDEQLIKTFKRFQKPLCHTWAERLILNTLGLYQTSELQTAHVRRAVLCACLTPLRQSVGSCFASAPAILIQREQIETFLDDLYELLSTGKLKRIYGGKEYAVPLSPNTGAGDLRKNLFLLDPKAMPWVSPGLMSACEVLGVIPAQIPDSKKADILKEYIKDKEKMTVEELIRGILLEQMQLSAEELEQADRISRSTAKEMQQLMRTGIESGLTKKVDRFEEFQQREREAKAAFMGVCDNALLKAWEYTLASFSDVKMEFSRWNLYRSLGFSTDERGGIGELIFQLIDEKLQKINEKIQQFQQETQSAFDAAKTAEALLRQAGSESEARRLQAEYQSRAYHMQSCMTVRDDLYEQGKNLSSFFSFLLEQYDVLFPEYFQEIYDPNMVEPNVQPLADSLAGFRLVYKHGRMDPSQWTLIYNSEEYIHCLVDFFSSTESRIAAEIQWEEGKKELSAITGALLVHLRTDIFLQNAYQRVPKAKPWGYLSGGTILSLLKTYFRKESDLGKEEKRPENEGELLTFLVDALKGLAPAVTDRFLEDKSKGMLMTSPTHAFILLPGQSKLSDGWQEGGFTYTWVRDQIAQPSQQFYSNMHVSQTQQIFLFDAFCRELPPMLIHDLNRLWHADPTLIPIPTFRQKMLEALIACADAKHPLQKKALSDGLDAFLFQILPIIPGVDWKICIKQLLSDLYDDAVREFLYPLNSTPCAYMSAKKIKELAKIAYVQSRRSLFSSFDLHQYIADHARFIGLAPPTSLIFADTNWSNQYFGFVVNPGTSCLELWSLDRTASQGTPMSDWKQWFSLDNRIPWTLYTNPAEYTAAPSPHLSKHFQKI